MNSTPNSYQTGSPPKPGDGPRVSSHEEVGSLLLGWCLWLLGTWAVTLMIDSLKPGSRWMVLSAAIGLMAIWPAVRLSQHDKQRFLSELWRILLDWLCLILILQIVIWPLRITSGWSFAQTGWIAGGLLGWSLLTGLLIAAAGRLGRVPAMCLCLLLLLGEPVVLVLFDGAIDPTAWWLTCFRPLQTLWGLTAPASKLTIEPWAGNVRAVLLLAVVGWTVVLVIGAKSRRLR
jgi:hypothetical protein